MSISCDIVLDLIPLVKDGVASQDSNKIVHNHIETCESCKKEYKDFQFDNIEEVSMKDKKILKSIKRSIFISELAILLIGAIAGIALTNTTEIFYNFLIMPIIGGISYLVFKNKWYIAPITIFIVSYLCQIIVETIKYGFELGVLYNIFFSIIYAVLVGLGTIIVMLLNFAFRKDE